MSEADIELELAEAQARLAAARARLEAEVHRFLEEAKELHRMVVSQPSPYVDDPKPHPAPMVLPEYLDD